MSLSIFSSPFHWRCVVGASNRKRGIISSWRNGRICFLYAALSSWVRGDKRMTNVRVDGGEWSTGAAQIGGGTERGESWEGRREKKSDGTCSFIRPFTPVATATCLEGTQERRHHWQKQQRGREWVRANESKLDRLCVWMRAEREEEVGSRSTTDSGYLHSLKEVWIWPSGTRLRSVMNIHSSLEVIQINVWSALLKFHQQRPRLWVWISLISPPKRTLLWDMKLAELIKPRLMLNIWN